MSARTHVAPFVEFEFGTKLAGSLRFGSDEFEVLFESRTE